MGKSLDLEMFPGLATKRSRNPTVGNCVQNEENQIGQGQQAQELVSLQGKSGSGQAGSARKAA